MVDTGAAPNLVKQCRIDPKIRINPESKIILSGITDGKIETLGTADIEYLGFGIRLHVVNNNFPISQDGILRAEFLRDASCINFSENCVFWQGLRVPFDYGQNIITIPARTRTVIPLRVSNPDVKESYIPRINLHEDVHLGDVVVTNRGGIAYVGIVNTSEKARIIATPTVELQEIEKFSSEDTNSGNEENNKVFATTVINDSLRLNHLNKEESDHVSRLIDRHQDLFHLLSKLLDNDVIKLSESPYNSPLWIVPKKADSKGNKRWRMIIDYSVLNEKTIGDAYPFPNITEILDQLGSAKYFSVFDLASGFHQISMHESHAGKTAFSTPHGHYEFNRMPFGLKNAPAIFQRLMDQVLSGLQGSELFVYLDDIVLYASSLREHEIKFDKLAERLRQANLKLQPDKCEFLRKEVGYLGHIISDKGVKSDPAKIRAVKEFPTPRNAKNIKQFLGLAGFYRRFIPNFSKTVRPLTNLLKKEESFDWTDEQESAFVQLREALCTEPILQYPDFTKPFVVTTDASGYAIGGILSQGSIGKDLPIAYTSRLLNTAEKNYSTIEKELLAISLTDLLKKNNTFNWQQRQTEAFNILRNALCSEPVLQYPDFTKPFVLTTDASGYAIGGVLSQGQIGKDLPIAYTSRVLNTAEQNYSTIEKECLAIIYCTNHFRPYLYSKKFTIITDHKPLVWLHSIKDPSSRLWKWRRKLAEYEYEIQYKKGSLNNNADALSRNPPTNYILPLFTANPVDESSNESTFSFEQDNQSAFKQTDITIEEYFSDDEMDRTIANSDEDSNQYEEIIDLNDEPQNTDRIIITENRDSLLKQSDNHVIFIYLNGTPFDNGAKEYQEANLLPNYQDLMYERANVKSLNHGKLISLPIKYNNRTNIEIQTLKNCIRSLLDVVMELELTSFSISKTDNFDDLPWHYIIGQIQGYLRDLPVHITVCKNLVRTPPFEQREALINENHSSAHGGHKGITKTYNRLRPHYYWKNMKKDIQNFIQRCRQCQLKKLTRIKTKQPMVITDTPGSAFDKVSLDIVGPLPITNTGNQYILTMQDLLTKYSVAVPLREATSLAIADALTKNFICIYGTPKAILTDQGTNFLSALMRNLTKRFNIQHFKTTAYHPQSNGSIERSHHVLTEYLKTQVEKEKEWDNYINMAMFSYNTSVHEGTKFSPFELIFGRIARLPSAHTPIDENLEITYQQYLTDLFNKINDIQEEARKNLIAAKERSKYYYDRKINPQNFRVGSYVFLLKEPARGKFSDQYTGPHEVIEILPQYNVKILIKNKPRIVHINKLKLAHVEPG
ncbi:hypothetical protein ACFW04_008643 [Cataglyphis niger]